MAEMLRSQADEWQIPKLMQDDYPATRQAVKPTQVPLFFANAEIFHDHVRDAIANAPTRTRWVVVAAEPITDVDITAADVLADLDDDLQHEGIELCFAEMKDPVKDRLHHYGLFTKFGADYFFPTLGQAVDKYLEEHQVEWVDWDEK